MIQMIDGNKFFDFGGTLAAQCHPVFINRCQQLTIEFKLQIMLSSCCEQ